MSLLLLAILGQIPDPNVALNRFAAFAKSSPIVQYEFAVQAVGSPKSEATLILSRKKAMRFDAKWRDEDYTFICDGTNRFDLERKQRLYDEMSPSFGLVGPTSRFANAAKYTFPRFALSTDLRKSFGPDAKIVSHGRQAGADVIEFIVATPVGKHHETFSIDAAGRPMKVVALQEGASVGTTWILSNVQVLKAMPKSALQMSIPNGFVPYAFPRSVGPLGVGSSFPLDGWRNGSTGSRTNLLTLIAGKRAVVAYLGSDSEPSLRCFASLKSLAASGIKVIQLGDTRAIGSYDSPSNSKALAIEGTPTFFVVDGKGKILHLMQGYDPDQRAKFESELRDAVTKTAATE